MAALSTGAPTWGSVESQPGERSMMGLGMGVGLLLMLLFWGLLVAGAVWLAKVVFSGRERPTVAPRAPEPNPREVLDQRYARGEITREEYELIRADLAL
jgi:putative membrane protein